VTERDQFLRDIFIIALEGGIGYWAMSLTYNSSKYNYSSDIVDAETEEEFEEGKTINRDTIIKGLNKIVSNEIRLNSQLMKDIAAANVTNDAGEIDAESADCIVQAGLFGEVRFG